MSNGMKKQNRVMSCLKNVCKQTTMAQDGWVVWFTEDCQCLFWKRKVKGTESTQPFSLNHKTCTMFINLCTSASSIFATNSSIEYKVEDLTIFQDQLSFIMIVVPFSLEVKLDLIDVFNFDWFCHVSDFGTQLLRGLGKLIHF